jgi:hypothetical protein
MGGRKLAVLSRQVSSPLAFCLFLSSADTSPAFGRNWAPWESNSAFDESSGFSAIAGPIVCSEREAIRLSLPLNAHLRLRVSDCGSRPLGRELIEPFPQSENPQSAIDWGEDRCVLDRLHGYWPRSRRPPQFGPRRRASLVRRLRETTARCTPAKRVDTLLDTPIITAWDPVATNAAVCLRMVSPDQCQWATAALARRLAMTS